MRTFVALLVLFASVAGCLDGRENEPQEAAAPTPPPEVDLAGRLQAFHGDHANPLSHLDGHGLNLLGHTDFANFYPPEVQGGWTDIDVVGNLVAVASMRGMAGATIVDITDPAAPTPLSFVKSSGADWDARMSPDGRFLFVGCQHDSRFGTVEDCIGQGAMERVGEEAYGSAIVAYNITDPANPVLAGYANVAGAHNLDVEIIDGTIYVFTNGVDILRFDEAAEAPLVVLEEVPGIHDAEVEQHPITGQWLLYTGSNSFTIYDVSNPAEPTIVLEEGPDVVAWHEQTVTRTLVDGRVLLLGAGESMAALPGPPAVVSVVDITDPTAPTALGEWTIPIDSLPPYANYMFSIHDIDVTDEGLATVAWYHAGLWVFDISTEERQRKPATVAWYQPHELPALIVPSVEAQTTVAIPYVWAAKFNDAGHLVVPDMYTGLYVLEFDLEDA